MIFRGTILLILKDESPPYNCISSLHCVFCLHGTFYITVWKYLTTCSICSIKLTVDTDMLIFVELFIAVFDYFGHRCYFIDIAIISLLPPPPHQIVSLSLSKAVLQFWNEFRVKRHPTTIVLRIPNGTECKLWKHDKNCTAYLMRNDFLTRPSNAQLYISMILSIHHCVLLSPVLSQSYCMPSRIVCCYRLNDFCNFS